MFLKWQASALAADSYILIVGTAFVVPTILWLGTD